MIWKQGEAQILRMKVTVRGDVYLNNAGTTVALLTSYIS